MGFFCCSFCFRKVENGSLEVMLESLDLLSSKADVSESRNINSIHLKTKK